METTTTTQPTTVRLRAVCEPATVDLTTGKVELTPVDPVVSLIQGLVSEIQVLQQKNKELETKLSTEKVEETPSEKL